MNNKLSRPVARCTRCGEVTNAVDAINASCRRKVGDGKRCRGLMRSAVGMDDWTECTACEATGYSEQKRCDLCQGVGWHYTRDSLP